jgi:hypothetical protein
MSLAPPSIGRQSCRRSSSSSFGRNEAMPASKAEQVLGALKALLETVPGAVVERNSVLPEKIPDGGLIILRNGDPGEPEQALGGFGSSTTSMRSRSRSMSRRATRRFGTPLSTTCSRRSAPRWMSTRPSAVSLLA